MLRIEDYILKSGGGKIDAITQTTISSSAVARIIRNGSIEKLKYIK